MFSCGFGNEVDCRKGQKICVSIFTVLIEQKQHRGKIIALPVPPNFNGWSDRHQEEVEICERLVTSRWDARAQC